MPEFSPRLSLPFLMPAQAQKHVTHNEALELLDALVQLSVVAFDAQTPPGAPEDGQIWALGAAPTGDWAGQAGALALWSNGGWLFIEPRDGWRAARGAEIRVRAAGAWVPPELPPLVNLPGLGVNASHDAVNRLTVAAAGTLLTHAGDDHRLTLNKAATADTASLLFQTGWSGRAELGLPGGDDLTIKVSADGETWHEGLRIVRTDGRVNLPNGASVAGHGVLHLGNLLGAVGESGGVPTGAVIERDTNANGTYIRFADGTQICQTTLNLGSSTAFGAGTWDNVWRTDIQTWTYPAEFFEPPLIAGSGTIASSVGNARRMVLSFRHVTATATDAIQAFRIGSNAETSDCTAYMIALGRWF